MLPQEDDRFGCSRSRPSQGSVRGGLTLASRFDLCCHCKVGSRLVLRRPIETTRLTRQVDAHLNPPSLGRNSTAFHCFVLIGRYARMHSACCSWMDDGYCEMAERKAREPSTQRKRRDQPLPPEITASPSPGEKHDHNTPTLSPESGLVH